MPIGINEESHFCDYYSQWISVYKEGAIREVTMGKYRLTQSWLANQFHARFFRKLTKQTITKNQFKGVLFDTPLFFHPFGKQEKRAFLTNF